MTIDSVFPRIAVFLVLSVLTGRMTGAQETEPTEKSQMRRVHQSLDVEPTAPELEVLSGVSLELVAQHPAVVTPTGIDVDDDGRVFVVSSHTHFRPDDYEGPEHDEVVVLSDEGRKRSVFYNATDATMDLELGPDGWVYLAERDRIFRVRDTDGDGVGDVEENLAVLDTEEQYPHNGLAGIAWHPSGDLIFSLGENYWKQWVLTAVDGSEVRGTGEGGVFRCTPDGNRLRRIAQGFWNPFGICVRDDGTMFAAENDPGARPPCRLLHVVEGGDYGYQRLYGNAPYHPFVAWNGELKGTLPMLSAAGEAPCGVVPFANGVLVPSWADHRIDFFPLTANGASFQTERVDLVRGGESFRPTCITQADDGSETGIATYYFADWVYGTYQLHGYGRVWKLQIDLAECPAVKQRQPAQPTSEYLLAEALKRGDSDLSVEKRFQLARGDDSFLARAAIISLSHDAKDWRAEMWRDRPVADQVSAVLALRLARPDDEAIVRNLLTIKRPRVTFEVIRWIADEQLVAFKPTLEELFQKSDLDFELFAATLAAHNTLNGNPRAGIHDAKVILDRLNDERTSAGVRALALRLMPPDHKALNAKLLKRLLETHPEPARMGLEVVRVLGNSPIPEASDLLVNVATDPQRSIAVRLEAVAALSATAQQHADKLLQLASGSQPAIREEALRALRFATLSAQQRTAIQSLAKTHSHLAELASAALDPQSLAETQRKQQSEQEWKERLAAVEEPIDVALGQRIFYHRKIGTCSSCHRHNGRGNVVGPDLTTIGNRSHDQILRSILQPSRDISPQFYSTAIQTEDGKFFTGIMLRKGGRKSREVYRDSEGKERSFARSEIAHRRELRTSLMPEGLALMLTDRELRDLLAFLVQSENVQNQ